MADFVELIEYLQVEYGGSVRHPVVAFGGSYGRYMRCYLWRYDGRCITHFVLGKSARSIVCVVLGLGSPGKVRLAINVATQCVVGVVLGVGRPLLYW